MDQHSLGFAIYFCVRERHHSGPCKDEKGRAFKPADRITPRKKRKPPPLRSKEIG